MDLIQKLNVLKQKREEFKELKAHTNNPLIKIQYTNLFFELLKIQEDLFEEEILVKDLDTRQVYLDNAHYELNKWTNDDIVEKKREYFDDFDKVKRRAIKHYEKLIQIISETTKFKTPPRNSQKPPNMSPTSEEEENGLCIIL